MYMEKDSTLMTSHVMHDPHLPFSLVFGDEKDLYRHMGFYSGDKSLLELGTNYHSKEVGKIVLVLSEKHANAESPISLPECAEGRLCYEMPRHVECDRFETTIYDDGIEFFLSDSDPIEYFKCAQVVFGFDEEKRIVKILVGDMSAAEILHLRSSLSGIDETRDKVFVFDGENWVEKAAK